MSAATLPILLPTLPGKAEGVVCMDPFTLQCQECAATCDASDLGMRTDTDHALSIVLHTSGIRFHPWPDGTNPRLCRPCRVARGCTCWDCARERERERRSA